MMLLYAALLGIVQGITEFLPVSSSAHLILARAFFGVDADHFGIIFDVAIHLGTLAAVSIYFWADIVRMLRAIPAALTPSPASHPARLIHLIVIGTIPIVIAGVLFADVIEEKLRTPWVTIFTLTIGALGFLIVERLGERTRHEQDLTILDSLLFGIAQSLALIPGMSRSGSTITMGMFLGVTRADAARFSFLLGIPAVIAAAAKEGLKLRHGGISGEMAQLFAVGILTSAVVGYLSIRFLLRYLATHRLDLFAYYRIALAAVVWWAFR
jgi:undecaprenyl-diphosphatase